MTTPQPSTSERPSGAEKPTRKFDLDYTQLSASALAAITAAVLGSTLGAAGTVIGAALASVVYTVSSTLYNHSLERSRERVRQLALKRTQAFPAQRADYPRADGPRTARTSSPAHDAPTEEIKLPAPRWETTPPGRTPLSRRLALRWPTMVVGTAGAFMLAMALIFGFEVASGQTLDGQQNTSTVAAVTDDGPDEPAPDEPTPEPVAPTPSGEPSAGPESSSAPGTTSEEQPAESGVPPEPSEAEQPAETGVPEGAAPEDAAPEIDEVPAPAPGE